MPTLNKRHVGKSRKVYVCDECNRTIQVGSSYWRLYGMAEVGEKPFTLRFCEKCEAEYKEMVGEIKTEVEMDKPIGEYKCLACNRVMDGSEVLADPSSSWWVCKDASCGGTVARVETEDSGELLEWVKELWELSPKLARQAEKLLTEYGQVLASLDMHKATLAAALDMVDDLQEKLETSQAAFEWVAEHVTGIRLSFATDNPVFVDWINDEGDECDSRCETLLDFVLEQIAESEEK